MDQLINKYVISIVFEVGIVLGLGGLYVWIGKIKDKDLVVMEYKQLKNSLINERLGQFYVRVNVVKDVNKVV